MDGGSWHCIEGSDQEHPQEKEMQKPKMVFWGGLTNRWEKKRSEKQRGRGGLTVGEKRREVKSKGGKERYIHFNAEFQRIARRDKKAFLSDQCKEIEGNNRMGKSRDLFKKVRDTKGIFH